MALYAITRNREVGVDIERINPSIIDEGMISQCLTAQEKVYFQTLPKNKRDLFFFECWTRKEAFLKARGSGLSSRSIKLKLYRFPIFPDSFNGDSGFRSAGWSFQTIPFINGYAAALTVEGTVHD